ncbi:MAG: hypothetical protein O3B01_12525 [Planctomycetota bacterium]|nr:hypothetical protein [Planctomycetota bacterium]MDA1139402.1 hypothetical protein [Planctomycetota bacterium]
MLDKIFSGLCFGVLSLGFVVTAHAADAVNSKCPVSGKDADGPTVTFKKATIGFCCDKCKSKFEAAPTALLAKVTPDNGTAINATCPLSGKDIDEDQLALSAEGETVATCCGKCLAKFKVDPAKFADKLK